jgi:hypothetical protein
MQLGVMWLVSEFAAGETRHREFAGAKCDRFAGRAVAGPVTVDFDAGSAGAGVHFVDVGGVG